jgi:hypothetical protein
MVFDGKFLEIAAFSKVHVRNARARETAIEGLY